MIPDCLVYSADLNKALTEAENLLESLLAMPQELQLESEIDFLDSQIEDLKQRISSQEEKTEKIFSLLRDRDYFAYLAGRMHYIYGYKWEEVTEYLGKDAVETVKSRVFRAIKCLQDEGLIDE